MVELVGGGSVINGAYPVEFLELILKTQFLGLKLKNKSHFLFPVKCFVVYPVKHDQFITKDGEIL